MHWLVFKLMLDMTNIYHYSTDIDECSTGRPCSQLCANTNGSYVCLCRPGYLLGSDNITALVSFQVNVRYDQYISLLNRH